MSKASAHMVELKDVLQCYDLERKQIGLSIILLGSCAFVSILKGEQSKPHHKIKGKYNWKKVPLNGDDCAGSFSSASLSFCCKLYLVLISYLFPIQFYQFSEHSIQTFVLLLITLICSLMFQIACVYFISCFEFSVALISHCLFWTKMLEALLFKVKILTTVPCCTAYIFRINCPSINSTV